MVQTSPAPPAQGACVFCGSATTNAARSASPLGYGEPNPAGTIPLIPMPPVWICNADVSRFQRHEITLGWCDGCQSWGSAFDLSPCGEKFYAL